ncbi:MAG: ferritin-like domain-containing protein [Planctomycetota bacterium]|jgi:rubrerythrin
MEDKYNCFEIFQIAEQVERNGAEVYREAAQKTDDEELSTMFNRLSQWEKQHEQSFAEMKKRLSDELCDKRRFDARQYMSGNPQALAKLAAFAINKDKSKIMAKINNKTEVLKQAIKIEKEAIDFFKGLKKFARDLFTKDQIGTIIKEEERHVSILEQSLEMR